MLTQYKYVLILRDVSKSTNRITKLSIGSPLVTSTSKGFFDLLETRPVQIVFTLHIVHAFGIYQQLSYLLILVSRTLQKNARYTYNNGQLKFMIRLKKGRKVTNMTPK